MERNLHPRMMSNPIYYAKGGLDDAQFPSDAGPIPNAPYIAFAMFVVVRIYGTPVSSTAFGNAEPEVEVGSVIGLAVPFT